MTEVDNAWDEPLPVRRVPRWPASRKADCCHGKGARSPDRPEKLHRDGSRPETPPSGFQAASGGDGDE